MKYSCSWGTKTIFPICGQYSFGFIATLLDGKFPNLHSVDYKVSRAQAIRKITSNEYRTQVMLSRSTHGDTYTLTHFEHTCYMPLILNFPINVDLTVTHNLPGPAIKFARVTRWSFGPLNNLQYYLARGHYFYNLGAHSIHCISHSPKVTQPPEHLYEHVCSEFQ